MIISRSSDAVNDPQEWGGCPECGGNSGFYHLGKDHWLACHAHRVRWSVGRNLFSGALLMDEAEQARLFAEIADYQVVQPCAGSAREEQAWQPCRYYQTNDFAIAKGWSEESREEGFVVRVAIHKGAAREVVLRHLAVILAEVARDEFLDEDPFEGESA